jgi:hypothetical protein
MKLCLHTGKYEKMMMSHMAGVARRIYSTGFIISQFCFAIGGLSINGECLADVLQLDTINKKCRSMTKESNRSMRNLKAVCSAACVPAFYSSRYDDEGVNLSLDRVT